MAAKARKNKARKRLKFTARKLLPFAVIAVVIAFVMLRGMQMLENRVSVENRSNVPLTTVEVKLGDEDLQFGAIPAPGLIEKPFKIKGDSSFTVTVTNSAGSMFKAQGPYMTNGYYGERIKFIVHQDRIEVVQTQK